MDSKEYIKTKRQFFTYLILFICVILIGFFVSQRNKNDNILLDKYGEVAEGVVIRIRNTTKGDLIRYRFVLNGKTYIDVTSTHKKNILVGDVYEVKYLTENPEINRINLDRKLQPNRAKGLQD